MPARGLATLGSFLTDLLPVFARVDLSVRERRWLSTHTAAVMHQIAWSSRKLYFLAAVVRPDAGDLPDILACARHLESIEACKRILVYHQRAINHPEFYKHPVEMTQAEFDAFAKEFEEVTVPKQALADTLLHFANRTVDWAFGGDRELFDQFWGTFQENLDSLRAAAYLSHDSKLWKKDPLTVYYVQIFSRLQQLEVDFHEVSTCNSNSTILARDQL